MHWWYLLGIAFGLAMDAFAVSIAVGLGVAPVTRRHVFRLAFHFGLFQFMMPVVGYFAGEGLAAYIASYDHWAAFGLLAFVGGKMLLDARHEKQFSRAGDPTRGLTLVTLSIATSIDALAVGLSLGFMQVSVWTASLVIGLVAGALTAIGITCAGRFTAGWGRGAEALGGCVLLGIGTRILITHMAG